MCVLYDRSVSTIIKKLIYDSYFGAKSLSIFKEVHQELGQLADVNTSSSQISRYLSDKLGISCSW